MQCELLPKSEKTGIGGDMPPIGRMNRRGRGTLDHIDNKERSMLPPGTKAAFITEYRLLCRRVRRCASRLEIEQRADHADRADRADRAKTSAEQVPNARAEKQVQ